MPWLQSLPKDIDDDRSRGQWAREIWTRLKFDTFPMTPIAIPASTTRTYTISTTAGDVVTDAVRGLRAGMGLEMTWPTTATPANTAGLIIDGYVTTNDALQVQIQNFTGVPLTPPAGNYIFIGMVL